jgi:hypothetical protein
MSNEKEEERKSLPGGKKRGSHSIFICVVCRLRD